MTGGRPLPASFYARDTIGVARSLLGCILATRTRGVVTSGRILEVEAYLGADDPAAHGYGNRKTKRNASLFAAPGVAYVYFIYGMHWCVNAVTERAGHPGAVLVRGLEPIEGISTMKRRRGGRMDLSGPGKVCQALGISGSFDGAVLDGTRIGIWKGSRADAEVRKVVVTPRIGISKAVDWPLRFLLEEKE